MKSDSFKSILMCSIIFVAMLGFYSVCISVINQNEVENNSIYEDNNYEKNNN